MPQSYVALLRAISNVSMDSFRQGMEALRYTAVASYGMSGNLFFQAERSDPAEHERRITAHFGTLAVVRTRADLARIVAHDPFSSTILFLVQTPTAARRYAFQQLDFEPPRPILYGKTVYFVHPSRLREKRSPFDFERALDVQGTARSARVVVQLLARMSEADLPARPKP